MSFNVHTMKEEPCCKDHSCKNERGIEDCESCGSHCAGCRYPAAREYQERYG